MFSLECLGAFASFHENTEETTVRKFPTFFRKQNLRIYRNDRQVGIKIILIFTIT